MSYKIYIDTGAGYVQFYPKLDECSLVRSKDKFIFSQDKLTGKITFKGDEATTLRTLLNTSNLLDAQIHNTAGQILECNISLLETYNALENTAELQTVVNDQYTKLINELSTSVPIPSGNTDALIVKKYVRYDISVPASYSYGAMKFTNLLKYCVGQADNTILFDSNSFLYMESFDQMDDFYISSFTNFLKSSTLVIENDEISLQKIFYYLSNVLWMDWNLELIGSDYYFRLKHKSEVSFAVGSNPVLTNYKGNNWTHDKQEYSYNEETRWKRLYRTGLLTDSVWFKGFDILIPSLEGLAETKTISLNDWQADVQDILVTKPTRYTGLGDSSFVPISCLSYYTEYAIFLPDSLSYINILEPTTVDVTIELNGDITIELLSDASVGRVIQIYPMKSSIVRHNMRNGSVVKYALPISFSFPTNPTRIDCTFTDSSSSIAYPFTAYDINNPTTFNMEFITNGSTSEDPAGLTFAVFGLAGAKFRILAATFSAEFGGLRCQEYDGNYGTFAKMNNRFSLAELDHDFATHKLPDTPATINNISKVVTVDKKFKTSTILFPSNSQNDINFNELVTTDLGDIEPTELKINLDGSMAELNGIF